MSRQFPMPTVPGFFDPALGRGYRVGLHKVVPAGVGAPTGIFGTQPSSPLVLVRNGQASEMNRYRTTMHVKEVAGAPAAGLTVGGGLRFTVFAALENEIIERTCTVSVGGSQTLYAPGRTLEVSAANLSARDLEAHIQVDEHAGGLSAWRDAVTFAGTTALAPGVETPLAVPNFCTQMRITAGAAAALTVNGYSDTGTLVYTEVLNLPTWTIVQRLPGLVYTLTPPAGVPLAALVQFDCVG